MNSSKLYYTIIIYIISKLIIYDFNFCFAFRVKLFVNFANNCYFKNPENLMHLNLAINKTRYIKFLKIRVDIRIWYNNDPTMARSKR